MKAAYFGKSVAVIGREHLPGGTAANTGTLPSKTLRGTSLFLAYATYDAPGRGATVLKPRARESASAAG
ncbi:MAG: hypothetical protein JO284_15440 [Planctomycetaceae bacterium]|nr:hypothetical protein [Planctomycetaceae bacterium]MBV8318174.1 hypothetical protein [Planctomycetaceae bacterium]